MCKILLVAFLLLQSTKSYGESACIIADSTKIVTSRLNIFLIYRVTGFQDKMEFFEVYDHKPQFDSCGTPKIPPIDSEPIENSKRFLKSVRWRNDKIEIIYTRDKSKSVIPLRVKLTN